MNPMRPTLPLKRLCSDWKPRGERQWDSLPAGRQAKLWNVGPPLLPPSQVSVFSYCDTVSRAEGAGDIRPIRYHALYSFFSFLYLTRLATALAALSGVGKFGIPEASSCSIPSSQIPLGAEMQQITGFFSLG